MESLPLVSVIIPTRDRLPLLQRALESVFNQSYANLEIIVVDDGSTDGTAETLAKDERIRLIRLEESVGGAAARNRGIAAAKGELIAFLDSDDEWLPEKIAAQVSLFQGDPDVGAVYCRHFDHDDETGVRSEARVRVYTGDIMPELLAGRCPRTVSLFVVRMQALQEVKGFDEGLRGFQDTDLWLRLAPDWEFGAVDAPLAVVHNHSQVRITTDISARREALDSFLGRWGPAMEAHIGVEGVRDYEKEQLSVAQGAQVLAQVRSGRRLRALKELGRYLASVGIAKPRQLAGLLLACVAGSRAHTALKRSLQRIGA
ncbi:MAG TPA: glycosyltransferase family A protein [Acidimicrobiia bacterium]|nr:glycosyltransferase family A protein [Acidimicrobiia bacterium]